MAGGISLNTGDFNRNLDLEKAAMRTAISQFHRYIALEALRRIVFRTPVGNPSLWKSPAPAGYVGGRAKGNWQTTIDTPANGVLELIDKSGTIVIAEGTKKILGAPPLHDIWISNNLPYIERLEDGWSTQAPSGMVGLTVAELQPLTRRA